MTSKVRLLLLACAGACALVASTSAFAAFTPTLAIGQQPPTLGSAGATSIRVNVPRDDDALFRAQIYAPAGYTSSLTQAAGTQIGTVSAQVLVREPIAGAVLPITGTILVSDAATYGASGAQCAQALLPTGTAYWVLVLSAAGTELRVPAYVSPAPAAIGALVSSVINICLPNPNIPVSAGGATFGAKLILAQLNLTGVLTAPSVRGDNRWNMITTPWPNGPGLPNAAGTVVAQGTAKLPGAVSIASTSKKRVLTITGRVTEAGTGIAGRTVSLRVGNRSFSVRTNASGTYRKTALIARGARVTIRATVAVPARTTAGCTTPPFAPPVLPCVTDTSQFFTVTRSIVARVR